MIIQKGTLFIIITNYNTQLNNKKTIIAIYDVFKLN